MNIKFCCLEILLLVCARAHASTGGGKYIVYSLFMMLNFVKPSHIWDILNLCFRSVRQHYAFPSTLAAFSYLRCVESMLQICEAALCLSINISWSISRWVNLLRLGKARPLKLILPSPSADDSKGSSLGWLFFLWLCLLNWVLEGKYITARYSYQFFE